jgi:hypothetical protein
MVSRSLPEAPWEQFNHFCVGGGEFDSLRWKQIRFLSHIGCVALIMLTAEATTNGTLQDIARQRHLRMGAMEAMLQEHPLRTS